MLAKHIKIDTLRDLGNMWLHVVYRPETDEILAKVGSDTDFSVPVYVYQGFKDITINDQMKLMSKTNRDKAMQYINSERRLLQSPIESEVSKELGTLFQTFAGLVHEKKYDQASEILVQAKQLSALHNVEWETLPKGWSIMEQELRDHS